MQDLFIQYQQFLQRHFFVFMMICWSWLFVWTIGSAVHRGYKGKAIFAKVPENALFVEKHTSGRSLKNSLTKIGGARNCLMVAVTRDSLLICPHFPFSLLFLPEIYGFDWKIPKSAIGHVQSISGGLFGKATLIEFKDKNGASAKVELRLRKPEDFEKAIGEMKGTWSPR